MDMQGTLAASGEVRERALSVVSEDARTEVAPAGSVVDNGHGRSLSTILSTAVDSKPVFRTTCPQLVDKIFPRVWTVALHIGR